MDSKSIPSSVIIAIGIAGGLGILGTQIDGAVGRFVDRDRVVTVKGLAEQQVPADRAIWPVSFRELGNDLQEVYQRMNDKTAVIVAFLKAGGIDEKEIRLREPIQEPDVVLVQDKTLLDSVDVFGGLHDNGYVLINSSATPEEMGLKQLVDRLPAGHVLTVPATRFALEKIGRPLPGAAMLAGFAAMTGGLKLESVQQAYLARYVGKVGEANAAVAELAYRHLQQQLAQ